MGQSIRREYLLQPGLADRGGHAPAGGLEPCRGARRHAGLARARYSRCGLEMAQRCAGGAEEDRRHPA
ncbi:hypothetical protein D3C84_915060 [compost metagenome]